MATFVFNHPLLGPVTLAPTRRARRLTISVKPSGEVRVSFPPLVGEERVLKFLEEHMPWALKARERMARRVELHPPKSYSPEEVLKLRTLARFTIPYRVAQLASKHKFYYRKLTLRSSRTKWGSCTMRKEISLSIFLMILPEYLRDFVILHELCHTVHMNHSPEFHALLDRLVEGREKELQKELKTYYIR